jgi:hypothetical protein
MKVYVAIYSHEYGEDVRVFQSLKSAEAWKDEIGGVFFSKEFPSDPRPDDNIGEVYFDLHMERGRNEWFSVTEADIEP